MLDKIIRPRAMPQVMGYSTRTAYTEVQRGVLPPPIVIGKKATGWPESEILAIQRARIAGKNETFIKKLVTELVAKRASLVEGLA